MKRRIVGFALLFLIIPLTTVWAQGSSTRETVQPGIDWERLVVVGVGIGIPGGVGGRAGQIKAAEMSALRDMLATIKGMQLTGETTVENAMLSSDIIRTRVQGTVQNYQRIGEPHYFADGSIQVVMEMDLKGQGRLFDIVFPPDMGDARQPAPAASSAPAPMEMPMHAGAITGLIIDARGLTLRPAIAPRILSGNGEEVYGSKQVDRKWAIENGMVSYAKNIDQARGNERITPNPLVIKALKSTGANMTDLVISNQDAATIVKQASTQKFLQECRVMVVVD